MKNKNKNKFIFSKLVKKKKNSSNQFLPLLSDDNGSCGLWNSLH